MQRSAFEFACSEFFLIVSRPLAQASDNTRPSAAIGRRIEREKERRERSEWDDRARRMSVVSTAQGRSNPRRTTHVEVWFQA
jgi:hypothetical protein